MGHAYIFDLIERGYFWPETTVLRQLAGPAAESQLTDSHLHFPPGRGTFLTFLFTARLC